MGAARNLKKERGGTRLVSKKTRRVRNTCDTLVRRISNTCSITIDITLQRGRTTTSAEPTHTNDGCDFSDYSCKGWMSTTPHVNITRMDAMVSITTW